VKKLKKETFKTFVQQLLSTTGNRRLLISQVSSTLKADGNQRKSVGEASLLPESKRNSNGNNYEDAADFISGTEASRTVI
jgi:hypothetical protein